MKLLCSAIETRHSCRFFRTRKRVTNEQMMQLLYAASLAPSGKNLQPWRFRIIEAKDIIVISRLLTLNNWFERVEQAICIFLNKDFCYDNGKDYMAIGACIQNILLEAEMNDISACWLGECSKHNEAILDLLGIPCEKYKLASIVAVGYGKHTFRTSKMSVDDLMI